MNRIVRVIECPKFVSLATMTCMGWSCHASFIVSHTALDVLLALRVMDGNEVATIEDMETIHVQEGFYDNELHDAMPSLICNGERYPCGSSFHGLTYLPLP